MATKLPSIALPNKPDTFSIAVKEILEVGLRRRGDPLDRFITLRELLTLLEENAQISTLVSTIVTTAGSYGSATTITLDASGIATLTGPGFYKLDTFGGAASDDLVEINGLDEGDEAILMAANDARTVIIKDGAKIYCRLDFELDSAKDVAEVLCIDGSICVVKGREHHA